MEVTDDRWHSLADSVVERCHTETRSEFEIFSSEFDSKLLAMEKQLAKQTQELDEASCWAG